MKRSTLIFDIETSFNIGIFWRTGYNQTIQHDDIITERAIICVSWKWEDEDEVYSLTWDKNQSDKQLLKEFIKELNKADEIIAHNGDRFDIKWLRTRCLKHKLPMFPKYQSIDTLKQARGQFNFNSNKLDYIAQFLKVGAKTKHDGKPMWKKIILKNDPVALKKMVKYCENDVLILEKVYKRFKEHTQPKINKAVLAGEHKFQCPRCTNPHVYINKTITTASGVIKRYMHCKKDGCNTRFFISNKTYEQYVMWRLKNNLK